MSIRKNGGNNKMVDVYGTDIDDSWTFSNGDINLISGTLNLGQAVKNRLMCDSDVYKNFYQNYGGNLFDEMGELNNGNAHEYLRIEIETILKQEPRINELECIVNKISTDAVECKLRIKTINNNEVVEMNLVINQDANVVITNEGEDI